MTSGWWVIKVGVPRGELSGVASGQACKRAAAAGRGRGRQLEVKAEKKAGPAAKNIGKMRTRSNKARERDGLEQRKYG